MCRIQFQHLFSHQFLMFQMLHRKNFAQNLVSDTSLSQFVQNTASAHQCSQSFCQVVLLLMTASVTPEQSLQCNLVHSSNYSNQVLGL